jgi:hypothetical protein
MNTFHFNSHMYALHAFKYLYIFIFNPNMDPNRVILMPCALYNKTLGTHTAHMASRLHGLEPH